MRSGGRGGGGVSSASGTGTGAAGAEVCRAAAARRHGWWDGLPRWACNLLCALPYGRSLSATASKAAKKRGSVAANHGRAHRTSRRAALAKDRVRTHECDRVRATRAGYGANPLRQFAFPDARSVGLTSLRV